MIFGNYIETNSLFHRANALFKLLFFLIMTLTLFVVKKIWAMGLFFIEIVLLFSFLKVSIFEFFKSIRAILILILITIITNALFTPGEIIFSFWKIKITKEGIIDGVFFSMRLILLLILSQILLISTLPSDIANAIRKLFTPLKKIWKDMPLEEFSIMTTIALRFIPVFQRELDWLIKAQRAKGVSFETFSEKINGIKSIILPILSITLNRAETLAVAMELRKFEFGKKRSKLYEEKYSIFDFLILSLAIVNFILFLLIRIYY